MSKINCQLVSSSFNNSTSRSCIKALEGRQIEGKKEVGMAATEAPKTSSPPQIVKLGKAFKLAERWVNNMSKAADDEPTDAYMEGRPSRLGLGAKVSRQAKVGPSNDPVDRKLYAKLNAEKRKTAKIADESIPSARVGFDDDDDDSKDRDSRTSAFAKRKAAFPYSSVMGNKKQK